jgi:3-oxoadipate enol-lactonase/4-carboxymuconolactone decarboxylase
MPFATHAGARLFWRMDGDAARPALLLLNSIGTDLASWMRRVPKPPSSAVFRWAA